MVGEAASGSTIAADMTASVSTIASADAFAAETANSALGSKTSFFGDASVEDELPPDHPAAAAAAFWRAVGLSGTGTSVTVVSAVSSEPDSEAEDGAVWEVLGSTLFASTLAVSEWARGSTFAAMVWGGAEVTVVTAAGFTGTVVPAADVGFAFC